MNASRVTTTLVSLLLAVIMAAAQTVVDTRTRIINPAFRSLQLKVDGNDQELPVIVIDGSRQLTIEFDELADDRRYMRYELMHCTWDWRPDGLLDSEILDGFNQADVEQYDFSQATLTHYVHYTITLPNPQMRPLISGNYLLRVYPEQEPEETLLQARFRVSEATMRPGATMSTRTDIDYNRSHQQLTLSVDIDRVPVRNINTDLRVVVEQNGRADNSVDLSMPTRVAGHVAYFEYLPELIFPAGNEYRRFETVSTRYPTMGVDHVVRDGSVYHFVLQADEPRVGRGYLYDQTQHGRFRIREYDSDESDTEAEYGAVYFTLMVPEMPDGDIFIDGDLVNRLLDPSSRMVYNRATGAYELAMYLKQGAYNYQYLFVPYGQTTGLTSRIEGDYCDTVNEYAVYVYTRLPGDRYDRLTAHMVIGGF